MGIDHWYENYKDRYRKLCQAGEYGKRRCFSGNCSRCDYFIAYIESDIGYHKDVLAYACSTPEEYKEKCAIKRDREEKYAVFQSIPNPFLRYYRLNFFTSSFENLSWKEIRSVEAWAKRYKIYRERLVKRITTLATEEYTHVCQSGNVPEINVPTLDIPNTIPKVQSKQCKKCGCTIDENQVYCENCDPYKDLYIVTSKLEANAGAFPRKAPLFAPSLRPIDVPASEYSRFESAATNDKLLEDKYINPKAKVSPQLPPIEKNTPTFYLHIQTAYSLKASEILSNTPKRDLYGNEAQFLEMAIALRISGRRNELTQYVDEYALVNYRKKQN